MLLEARGPQKLELQTVVRCLAWVLGTGLLQENMHVLATEPSLQPGKSSFKRTGVEVYHVEKV